MKSTRWLAVIVLLTVRLKASAADGSASESSAFRAAEQFFALEQWPLAEAEFAAFVTNYPASDRLEEAVLRRGQAGFRQGKYEETISLLQNHLLSAGRRADRYLYWIGEAHFQLTNYLAAAETFSLLARDFTNSERRLEASVRESTARARLGQWDLVASMLSDTNGLFQKTAALKPADPWVVSGLLLLTEAQLAQLEYAAAGSTLTRLDTLFPEPEQDWQRQQLRVRVLLASGRLEDARAASDKLESLATGAGRADFLAESVALEAMILEKLDRPLEAMAAYQRNLAPEVSASRQREALAKIVDLALVTDQLPVAEQTLDKFLVRFPDSAAADVAALTLGEVMLKQYASLASTNNPAAMEQLGKALPVFDRLIGLATNSVYLGKAQLDRGWCLWLTNRNQESLAAFEAATRLLPQSEDLAVAQLKRGDLLFEQRDFSSARDAYIASLTTASALPDTMEKIGDLALYQLARSCIELKDASGTDSAIQQLLALKPRNPATERGMFLTAQFHADVGDPEQARKLFAAFVEAFPDSKLRPEVELALARVDEQAGDWQKAYTRYSQWLDQFPTNALRDQAEFYRAVVADRSFQTNAFLEFTNFLSRYPNSKLAPAAQWWIADYYFQEGNYFEAELNFKPIFQTTNWAGNELYHEARMMAGRAAVNFLNYENAITHFTNLTTDRSCPPDLLSRALFAYADTLLKWEVKTNRAANIEQALQVYLYIIQRFPNSEIAALAWGQSGSCYLQFAVRDDSYYFGGTNTAYYAFSQVTNSPAASVSARCLALMGMGEVMEKLAERSADNDRNDFLHSALNHYLAVFIPDKSLRPGETADLFYVQAAGLKAAHLCGQMGEWPQAQAIYEALMKQLPPLQSVLEKRRDYAKAQLESSK